MSFSEKNKLKGSKCEELMKIVHDAAAVMGIHQWVSLSSLCTMLSDEQVLSIWHGDIEAKFCDVEYVLNILNVKVRWSK